MNNKNQSIFKIQMANTAIILVLLLASVVCKPARPVTSAHSISDSGRIKLSDSIEQTIATKFASLVKLPSAITDLDAEFDQWKAILPSATAGSILLLVILLMVLRSSTEKKFLELKLRVRNLERKKNAFEV